MWKETAFETWARQFLAALHMYGVGRFDDLPELEKANLHSLAGAAWPAVAKTGEQTWELALDTSPDQVDQVARQLIPEMDVSGDEYVQLANYRVALRVMEALWESAQSPGQRHRLGEIAQGLN